MQPQQTQDEGRPCRSCHRPSRLTFTALDCNRGMLSWRAAQNLQCADEKDGRDQDRGQSADYLRRLSGMSMAASSGFAHLRRPCETKRTCSAWHVLRNTDTWATLSTITTGPLWPRSPRYLSAATTRHRITCENCISSVHRSASHSLLCRHYGGWVCPNIFYLGSSGVVNFGGLRIAGISGIHHPRDYRIGYYEKMPYSPAMVRSAYHYREFEIKKLLKVATLCVRMKRCLHTFVSKDYRASRHFHQPRMAHRHLPPRKRGRAFASQAVLSKRDRVQRAGSGAARSRFGHAPAEALALGPSACRLRGKERL